MADTLYSFTSHVRKIGIARTNRYEVLIHLNPKTGSSFALSSTKDLLRLFCTRVNIPDISVDTSELSIFGEQRIIPYRPRFGPASLSFYMDNDFAIKKFFDDWISEVSHPTNRMMGYHSSYAAQIDINVLPVDEISSSYSLTLLEAYPKSIENISLDSSSKGPLIFTVTLNYKNYLLGEEKGTGKITVLPNDPASVNTSTGIPADYNDQINWQLPTQ